MRLTPLPAVVAIAVIEIFCKIGQILLRFIWEYVRKTLLVRIALPHVTPV